MALKFPSDEWIKALCAKLNESEAYEKSAKDWEGDFIFLSEADAQHPDPAYLYLDLYHGKCRSAKMLSGADEVKAAYTLASKPATWRQVIDGKLDPIQGMMTRKLKLKGNMMKIMRYPKAAKEIVACCALIPTDFL